MYTSHNTRLEKLGSTWFELSRVNYIENDLKGYKNWFELAGGSSYRGFELPGVKLL